MTIFELIIVVIWIGLGLRFWYKSWQNKILFVTMMYRHGEWDNHSYPVYAGFDKQKAIEEGKKEHGYRGNKYDYSIWCFNKDGKFISREMMDE